jgi:3-carboxy-cis,cis-muconate cycloisomerase
VVPLVRALVATNDGKPAPVHRGATSQDAMDTAAMLVAARTGQLLLQDLGGATAACAALATRHRHTLMTARTLLQPALPTTFGLKAAGWLVGLSEAYTTLAHAISDDLAVQLGGAAGTMAAFGSQGPALSRALAHRLGLQDPTVPWHTDRSRVVRLGAALVAVASACAKVAFDVALLAQAEVGELAEGGTGRGGSSTMPQKANPIGSVSILAASRHAHGALATLVAASVQDHERAGTGGWHAEWAPLTDLLRATGGCAAGADALLTGLVVNERKMAENLAATHGVVLGERVALDLLPDLGQEEARAVAARATASAMREGRHLREVLAAMPEVATRRSPAELDALCDPAGYLGSASQLIDRALAAHTQVRGHADGRGRGDGRAPGGRTGDPQASGRHFPTGEAQ